MGTDTAALRWRKKTSGGVRRGGDIIIYDDPRAQTSISCLPQVLSKNFPDRKIYAAPTEIFMRALGENRTALAVIPGIWSEDSKYYDLMGGSEGQKTIRDFVANSGLLMTICAGSYLVSSRTEYAPPWGARRERDNPSALFNALARGPLQGMGREPVGDEWYDGVHAVPIKFKAADGTWKKTRLAYGNGPALFPYERDHDYEVLARYDGLPDSPIAAAWHEAGKGAALWLGILPHIGWQPVDNHPSVKKVWDLMNQLKAQEPARKEFWDGMIRKIENHLVL